MNEDRQGRPFVGRAGDLLVRLLGSIGWQRDDVFITNIVKCRPPENRDPEPDEVAACAPYLRRQLEVLDPALVVTLGRHSMARFMPGTTISRAHGTVRSADPATGARGALVLAMYHPAAALRTPAIEQASYADVALVPSALDDARAHRAAPERPEPAAPERPEPEASAAPSAPPPAPEAARATPPASVEPTPLPLDRPEPEPPAVDQLTLFR
jgi:uracil-DNA glycosylase family 4